MYICNNCRCRFEIPDVQLQWNEHFGFPSPETWDVCPYCASTDFESDFEVEIEEECELVVEQDEF